MTLNNEIPQVIIEGDKISVTSLVVVDQTLAAYMENRKPEERLKVMEQALRIGLMALQSVVGSIHVDYVGRAVEKLIADTKESNKKAIEEVKKVFDDAFKKDGGTMPAGLEKFLGDEGQLVNFTKELFDPKQSESAFGRLGTFMEEWFGGRESKLGEFLDPDREGSTFHLFRKDIFEKIAAISDKISEQKGVKRESRRGTLQGRVFEELIFEKYTDILQSTSDLIEATGNKAGLSKDVKKGDAVIHVNSKHPSDPQSRIVVEVKNTVLTAPEIEKEMISAKQNHNSEIALMIFSLTKAGSPDACFELHRHGIICYVNPEDPDTTTLTIAYRLTKIYAEATRVASTTGLDLIKFQIETKNIENQLKSFTAIKTQLTSINTTTEKIEDLLEVIENNIKDAIAKIEKLTSQPTTASN
jgi:hypothetical protein